MARDEMSQHPLAGHFPVEASARTIRHYRYVEERMMRAMAGWIALTPELPAKLVLGRHVWDCAQHADLWGKRLPELRAAAQRSEPPNDRVVRFMDLLEGREGYRDTPERLAGIYRVLKPHLVAAYERHLGLANPVYEPPTRRILERCVAEERRHVAAGAIVLAKIASGPAARDRVEDWERELVRALADAGGVTGDGSVAPSPTIDTAGVSAAGDIVALDGSFDDSRIEPDLRERVAGHARAVAARQLADGERDVDPDARQRVADEYAKLGAAPGEPEIVACAVVGDYRLVKVRFTGRERTTVMQLRWRKSREGWRLIDAAAARTEPAG